LLNRVGDREEAFESSRALVDEAGTSRATSRLKGDALA